MDLQDLIEEHKCSFWKLFGEALDLVLMNPPYNIQCSRANQHLDNDKFMADKVRLMVSLYKDTVEPGFHSQMLRGLLQSGMCFEAWMSDAEALENSNDFADRREEFGKTC